MKTQLIKTIEVESKHKLNSVDCALWLKLKSGCDSQASLLMVLNIGDKKIKLPIDKNTLTMRSSIMLNNQIFLSQYSGIKSIDIYLNSDNPDIKIDTMHILEHYPTRRSNKASNLKMAA